MSNAEPHSQAQRYNDSILMPLVGEKRFRELCDRILDLLEREQDSEFRFTLISDLSTFLRHADDDEGSFRWAQTLTREFEDYYLAWMDMAGWYFYSPHPDSPSEEDKLKALGHYKTALQKARKANEFVRFVLFDICRVLTSLEDYGQLTIYMNEILEDLESPREDDIPQFEADWLKRVPVDALDRGLRKSFKDLEATDLVRRRSLGLDAKPPTRWDLDKYL